MGRGTIWKVVGVASLSVGIGGWGTTMSGGHHHPVLGEALERIGAIGFVASILWGFVASLSWEGWAGWSRARKEKSDAPATYTSAGLKVSAKSPGVVDQTVNFALNGEVMSTRKVLRSMQTVHISTDGSESLAQPLTLRVLCTRRPKEISAAFYTHGKDLTSRKGNIPVEIVRSGNKVFITLRDEKLVGDAMLSLTMAGYEGHLTIREVKRLVGRHAPPLVRGGRHQGRRPGPFEVDQPTATTRRHR